MKRITDKDFRYTSAAATDLAKTFARVRREMAEQQKRSAPVVQIKARVGSKPTGRGT